MQNDNIRWSYLRNSVCWSAYVNWLLEKCCWQMSHRNRFGSCEMEGFMCRSSWSMEFSMRSFFPICFWAILVRSLWFISVWVRNAVNVEVNFGWVSRIRPTEMTCERRRGAATIWAHFFGLPSRHSVFKVPQIDLQTPKADFPCATSTYFGFRISRETRSKLLESLKTWWRPIQLWLPRTCLSPTSTISTIKCVESS